MGCETAIDGWESELSTDISDSLVLEGRATGRDHFFRFSGGCAAGAAGGTIEGWESESRTDISDILLLEGRAIGRAHFFRDSGGGAARIVLGFSTAVSVNGGEEYMGCWERDQTLAVGVRRGGSGLGVHSYRYGVIFGTLGCKVVGNGSVRHFSDKPWQQSRQTEFWSRWSDVES